MGGKNSGRGPRPRRKRIKTGKLNVRMSPELLDRLREASTLSDIRQSAIVESALVAYLDKLTLPDKDGRSNAEALIV